MNVNEIDSMWCSFDDLNVQVEASVDDENDDDRHHYSEWRRNVFYRAKRAMIEQDKRLLDDLLVTGVTAAASTAIRFVGFLRREIFASRR